MPLNLLVVDISHHNTVTSFDAMYKSGIRGVIHKASQGVGMVDKFYAQRRQAALDAGLLWGAYHFGDGSNPVEQAKHFIESAAPDDNTLMALDYEKSAFPMNIKQARTFLDTLDTTLGRKNVIYSGDLIKETLTIKDSNGWWKSHPLWLAQYGKSLNLPPQWDNAFLWQFSDGTVNVQGTRVAGVTGLVDRNSYSGEDLAKDWVVKVAQKPVIATADATGPVAPDAPAAEVETPGNAWTNFWHKLFHRN